MNSDLAEGVLLVVTIVGGGSLLAAVGIWWAKRGDRKYRAAMPEPAPERTPPDSTESRCRNHPNEPCACADTEWQLASSDGAYVTAPWTEDETQ